MILARKFTLAKDDDYEHLAAASGRLRILLEAFVEDRLPPEYGTDQLSAFALSLISHQRPDGSFASFSNPELLDSDVRSDAHRFVTWAALAFLCRLQNVLGLESEGVEGLDQAIKAALRSPAAADFSFPESGSAEPVQQIEAVLILGSGGVPLRLSSNSGLSPDLKASLDGLKDYFRERIETGNTMLAGGIDYDELFRQALACLET